MKRPLARAGLALLAICLFAGTPAHAQLFRAYLASYGADTNPCTLPAPCRLLPAALSAVASGGEIWMLDSANYNTSTVTISKSVSIQAVPGETASVVAIAGAAAIAVTAPGASIAIRDVAVTSMVTNPGTSGLAINDAADVSIEDSSFADLPSSAIEAGGSVRVHVKKTLVRNAGGRAVLASNGPTVDIANSHFISTSGVVAYTSQATTTTVSITDSEISGGASAGIGAAADAAGAVSKVFVTRTKVHDVFSALEADVFSGGSASIYAAGSSVVHNYRNVNINGTGATIYSSGDNLVADAIIPDMGSLTVVSRR